MLFYACPGVFLDIREGQPQPPLRLTFFFGGPLPSFFVSAGPALRLTFLGAPPPPSPNVQRRPPETDIFARRRCS